MLALLNPLAPRAPRPRRREGRPPAPPPPLRPPPRSAPRPLPRTTVIAARAAAAYAAAGSSGDAPKPSPATATSSSSSSSSSVPAPPTPGVAANVAAVLGCGVLNRVLYRMALVPMAGHTFALAQFQNTFYVAVYGLLVLGRCARGRLPLRHLSAVPLRRFAVPGACEAAAQLLLMRGAAQLPGAVLPLLAQTTLAWSLLWRAAVLRVAPTRPQAAGVALVAAGVALASLPAAAVAAASPSSPAAALTSAAVLTASPANVALCVLSFAFPALATILKEAIFRDAAAALNSSSSSSSSTSGLSSPPSSPSLSPSSSSKRPSAGRRRKTASHHHKPEQLDVLVVNLATSAFQAAFVLALLPLAAAWRGVHLSELPALLAAGGRQLWGGSPGALALVPLAYVAVNIAFNVLSLGLVRAVGAVPTALTASAMVPLTVAAFALPLPLLAPSSLGAGFWPGAALAVAGLAVYNGAAEPGGALTRVRVWACGSRGRDGRAALSPNEAKAAEADADEAPPSGCAERRSWHRAADLAGAEAEAAAAAAAAAAARLADKCDGDEGAAAEAGAAGVAAHRPPPPARVVVLPAAPLPPSHRLGVVPPSSSPLPLDERDEGQAREEQQQQQQREQAVPSP